MNIKFWTIAALSGATLANADTTLTRISFANYLNAAETGEGGEAGPQPSSYQLMLDESVMPKYDAQALKREYIQSAFQMYALAEKDARALKKAVDQLIAVPSEKTLSTARQAWLKARTSYLPTEVFRYYEGPIDGPASAGRAAGPESRINAWPLNEAVIDYVPNTITTALILDATTEMTVENIKKRDQASDEADVTTGFHAIEFMLWGQDHSETGPGDRPAGDFKTTKALESVRRRAYLTLVSQLLIDDIASVRAQWDLNQTDSYAQTFQKLNDYEAVGRMLRGIAMLSVEELASERLSVPLDSGTQEDETSCFSDNTHAEFSYGLLGIQRIWRGEKNNSGISELLGRFDPALAQSINQKLDRAINSAAALPAPFDQMLLSDADSPRRKRAEALVSDLTSFGQSLRDAGRKLGVLVSVPGA